MLASSQAQPACVQDYNSDDGVETGPKSEARRSQRPISRVDQGETRRSQRTASRAERQREPTPSDSGYSSHTSGTKTVKPADPAASQAVVRQGPLTPSGASSKSSGKTVIHRHDSGRIPTMSQSQPQSQCPDPYCRDPNCPGTAERRPSMSQAPRKAPQQAPPPAPPPQQQQPRSIPYTPSAAAQYQQQAHIQQSYYYPYPHMANPQMAPVPMAPAVPQAVPRPRAASSSRPRPLSIHGYPTASYGTSYDDSQRGPPPSASAYYSTGPMGYPQQHGGHPASTPTDAASAGYPPYSPGPTSPTSPMSTSATAAGYLAGGNMYSTRRGNPTITGLVVPKVQAPPPMIPTRSLSARRSEHVRPPAPALPDTESPEYSSESGDSASDDEYDGEIEHSEHVPRRRVIEPPSRHKDMILARRRRPSLNKPYKTTANVISLPIHDSRPQEPLRRAPSSDSDFNYYSSDYVDSDRTTRAILPARDAPSRSCSRRPSIFTNPSTDRTKSTAASGRSDPSRVIIEDRAGRRVRYVSNEEADRLKRLRSSLKRRETAHDLDARQAEQMHLNLDEIDAYQRCHSGDTFELTAENIHKSQNRKSGSHFSGVRTHRSSHSGSKASRTGDGGIRIESGGTVLHVYGDAQIEMRRDEEGGPAHLIVNGGRDSGYNTSSRSTDSRHGRSRIGSEMGRHHRLQRPIYEDHAEGGYERNM